MALLPAVGDRIRMVDIMPDDPNPMPVGAEGTVTSVNELSDGSAQISVEWDSRRTLMVLSTDPFVVVRRTGGE